MKRKLDRKRSLLTFVDLENEFNGLLSPGIFVNGWVWVNRGTHFKPANSFFLFCSMDIYPTRSQGKQVGVLHHPDKNIGYRGNIDGSKIGNFNENIEEISKSVNIVEK